MNTNTKGLLAAALVVIVLLLFFGNGAMTWGGTHGGMMGTAWMGGQSGMGGLSWMWMPLLLVVAVVLVLGIFREKR